MAGLPSEQRREPMRTTDNPQVGTVRYVDASVLEERTLAALREAGANEPSARAAVRALMHASRIGVDSHGVRLVAHYARALRGGQINGAPQIAVRRTGPAAALVDADDGLGH